MVDAKALLADLKKLLTALEADLRERAGENAEMDAWLRAEHAAARDANRTADAFEIWREEMLTQAGANWILTCVFARFLEDNRLVPEPRLSGPGERLERAKDHHTVYFQEHPHETDREYLQSVFADLARLPGCGALFGREHNLLWKLGLSGDGAAKLLEFWRRIDPATGAVAHDFTDPEWSTRFLGDLYQDLSEAARKRYALLQTPEFVEEFILDRTLGPAIDEFGWREVRLIDPTCGSGHFLLGAFRRLFDLWARNEPGTNARELAQRALDQVYGVDVNPYAAAIARFRLLLAALRAAGTEKLADAPAFRIHIAAGDSLLHGPRFTETRGPQLTLDPKDTIRHVYLVEDREELARILGQQYHAVVGNPPYITVKDKALNQAYRDRYGSCHRQVLSRCALHGAVLRLGSAGRGDWRRARRRLRRHDHGQLVHEARVRQETDRGVHPALGPDARHRHLRRLHPRSRHADGYSLRPAPPSGGANSPSGDGNPRRAADAGRSGEGSRLDGHHDAGRSARIGERVRQRRRHVARELLTAIPGASAAAVRLS